MKSQKETIKDILLHNKDGITSMEAFNLGITRLSAIIFDLRAEGLEIKSEMKHCKNRYGNNCNYAIYKVVTH